MATVDDGAVAETGEEEPSLLALVKVVVYKHLILLVRYPVNTISRFLTLLIFFLVVFFGGKAVAGAALTDSLDGIIVGFFIYTFSVIAYSGLAWNVTREAQWGTLERLYISPHGFGTVMSVKTVVNVTMGFMWAFLLLLAMMLISDRWLTIDPLTVLPLMVLTLLSVLGIGFLFARLAIVYKRIENMFQLVQFGFVGLIAAPAGRIELLKLLPVTHGSYLLRVAIEDGVRLWEFSGTELGLLTVTSVVYLLVGYRCFRYMEVKARDEGLMGHY